MIPGNQTVILSSNSIRQLPLLLLGLILIAAPLQLPAATLDTICVPDSFQEPLADISTVTAISAMLLPALSQAVGLSADYPADQEGVMTIALVYGGTLSLTYAAATLVKELFPRTRPFPALSDDADASFPSRHTAMVTAAASFAAITGAIGHSTDALEIITIAGSWSAAVTTGILRVVSGEHYLSDVIAGALLGAGIGLLGGMVALHAR